jgi:RNA polymerase sigma factor (sigma-70 family)
MPSRDDAAAFTRVFDEHRHAVHAYFTGRVADPELRQQAATEPATVPGPHLGAEADERRAQLDAAIRRLPEELRVTLTMATAGGLTSRQIGEALGEPAGTIRYRLSRARTQLAADLDLEEPA